MKNVFALISVLSFSSSVFAAGTCGVEALTLAKMNLDAKAKAYAFEESYIDEASLKLVNVASNESVVLSVRGAIYKAQYKVEMKLDSSCSLETLKIKETAL